VSNLTLRLLSAAVLVPIVIAGIIYGGWLLRIECALACLAVLFEYGAVVAPTDRVARALLIGTGMTGMVCGVLINDLSLALTLMAILVIVLSIPFVLRPYEDLQLTFRTWITLAGGLVWVVPAMVCVCRLRDMGDVDIDGIRYGPTLVCLCLVVTWANDTGAYFAGRFLGKHHMAGRISPKKTWEGFVGGMCGALAFAVGMRAAFPTAFGAISLVDIVCVVIPVSVLGPMGDLAESLFKRAHNVKDSGNLIPGHGGMFDRVDAVLFTAPWVMLYFATLR
jgi:phosphatidate cytidylyltransferase